MILYYYYYYNIINYIIIIQYIILKEVVISLATVWIIFHYSSGCFLFVQQLSKCFILWPHMYFLLFGIINKHVKKTQIKDDKYTFHKMLLDNDPHISVEVHLSSQPIDIENY